MLTTPQCDQCKVGRVSHSHSEPINTVWMEVYECDNCDNKLV